CQKEAAVAEAGAAQRYRGRPQIKESAPPRRSRSQSAFREEARAPAPARPRMPPPLPPAQRCEWTIFTLSFAGNLPAERYHEEQQDHGAASDHYRNRHDPQANMGCGMAERKRDQHRARQGEGEDPVEVAG